MKEESSSKTVDIKKFEIVNADSELTRNDYYNIFENNVDIFEF